METGILGPWDFLGYILMPSSLSLLACKTETFWGPYVVLLYLTKSSKYKSQLVFLN